MITQILGIDAIEHGRPCRRGRDRRQQPVQLPLAGVAALLRVTGVGRICQLRRSDLPVGDPQPASLLRRLRPQVGG
jgi:hypothetical protein